MILADTGPLVALFDPKDPDHASCVATLKRIQEPLATTVPVMTEAFHLLTPDSLGSQRLMDFTVSGGLLVLWMDEQKLTRAFELMLQYADQPMDLADASLVVTAESEATNKIFTIDRDEFATYRIRRGHRHHAFIQID